MGTCRKVHSDLLKLEFEGHPDRAQFESEYEKEFLTYLEGLIFEADAWIGREKKNCKAGGKETRIPPRIREQIEGMQKESDRLMNHAEDLGEQNDLAGSKEAMHASERLREEIETIKATHTVVVTAEEVCMVCGVRCQPGEIADYQAHLDGKLHEGYTRIREKVRELRENQRNPRRERERDGGAPSDREKKAKTREREGRSRSQDRESRRKTRSRSRSRGRRR